MKCSAIKKSGEKSPYFKGGTENHRKHVRERYLKIKIIGSHTPAEWEALKMKYGYMCLCCKSVEPIIQLSRDHIVPLSKGGSDDIGNLQPLCRSCNSRKYNKTINFIELSEQVRIGELK